MKKGLTEVVFIIDKSMAMRGLEDDVIREFNFMLERQQDIEGEALVTTMLFDDRYELFHDRTDIRAVALLTREEYVTEGKTALLDAIGRAMHKFRRIRYGTKEEFRAEKVIFVIITGSRENVSRGYTEEMIRQRIEYRKKKYGWEFVFFGANMDGAAEAGKIGISADWVQSFRADQAGIRTVFAAVSAMLATFRKDAMLSCEEKQKVRETRGNAVEVMAETHFLRDWRVSSYEDSLRTWLGDNTVFMGNWIISEELLEGEISAYVFTIGCYDVRIAKCLYVDDGNIGVHYMDRVPASWSEINEYRYMLRTGQAYRELNYPRKVRMVTELSARYNSENGAPMDGWKYICIGKDEEAGLRFMGTDAWPKECIEYACVVKRNSMTPDRQAVLFISKKGQPFTAIGYWYWYKFTSDGKVEVSNGQNDAKFWEL